jgi:hypothetical protein
MWQGWNVRTEADLAARLDSFRILFACNSNKIENGNTTYGDTCEVFADDQVTGYTGDTRTITEIQNQNSSVPFSSEPPFSESISQENKTDEPSLCLLPRIYPRFVL